MKLKSQNKKFNVAVIGATGAVGRQMLSVLLERKFPVSKLIPFASAKSVGKEITFGQERIPCRELEKGCFTGVDFAFFDASDEVSNQWVSEALSSGVYVIDNSGAFRMDQSVPLIVPEVNGDLVNLDTKMIAGPNCSTVQMVAVLNPVLKNFGLKRVVVSTYQSVSGAGTNAMAELFDASKAYMASNDFVPKSFVHSIGFNCIPQIGKFLEDGYTSEERKMILESRKILRKSDLKITATTVRVPTEGSHCESINIECERSFEISQVMDVLKSAPGLVLLDDPKTNQYPMNINTWKRDPVYVGRVRRDDSVENGINLWVVADNLRKGAALNAIQVGELIVSKL
jgi:aspartate-semialdehyde dehydrogenase